MDDGEKLVAWLREGAAEIEKAHKILDEGSVPRRLLTSNTEMTLAARIAYSLGMRPEAIGAAKHKRPEGK